MERKLIKKTISNEIKVLYNIIIVLFWFDLNTKTKIYSLNIKYLWNIN